MTAISSGLHFLSGIAVHFGALPLRSTVKPIASRKQKRHKHASVNSSHTPLSERQKKELLESIRHDDWFE